MRVVDNRLLLLSTATLLLLLNCGCHSASSMRHNTVIFGLNPALQRTIALLPPGLTPGAVNRGTRVDLGIGGKGQNAFVAATCMGVSALPALAQWVGKGPEGDMLLGLLGTKAAGFDEALTVRVDGRLRNAITLLGAETTEVVEPSGQIAAAEVSALLERLQSKDNDGPKGLAFMGSVPKLDPPTAFYPLLASALTTPRTILLIDATEALSATVTAARSRSAKMVIIKLNCREVLALVGLARGGSESSSSSGDLIAEGCRRLSELVYANDEDSPSLSTSERGSEGATTTRVLVAATDGPFQAHLIELHPTARPGGSESPHYTFTMPPLPRAVENPIGAGDAVSSGTIMAATGAVAGMTFLLASLNNAAGAGSSGGREEGDVDVVSAFRWGLACGAASCLSPSNSVFSRTDVEAIFRDILVSAA